jgi:class 3 adenylate cyclase
VLERAQRRLAAILAADVVGYSRLVGQDETGTLRRLKELQAKRAQRNLRSLTLTLCLYDGGTATRPTHAPCWERTASCERL